jgi:opacity protein-like surface antigen
MKRLFAVASALVLLASSAFVQAQNAPQPPAAPAPGITGTMEINYVTRQPQGMDDNGKPKKGVQDQYKLDLTVNGNNQFQGTILRQPRIRNAVYMTTQQPRYDYSINLFVSLKDGTKPNVGSWVGPMQVDEKSGAFILDAEGDRALRMNITAGSGFTDAYGGRFFGKAADKSKLSWDTITRTVNGKTIEKKFEADPMRFEGVRLAKGVDAETNSE